MASTNQNTLTNQEKKYFRQLGHKLKPVVTVASKGLSENVMLEMQRALEDHELIKVKLVTEDKEARKQLVEQILTLTQAALAQSIGNIILLYKAAKEPNPKLSNLIN